MIKIEIQQKQRTDEFKGKPDQSGKHEPLAVMSDKHIVKRNLLAHVVFDLLNRHAPGPGANASRGLQNRSEVCLVVRRIER